MKSDLNYENYETKKLLCKFDFEFFLTKNFEDEKYTEERINEIYESYKSTKIEIKKSTEKNKKQFNLYCESKVRKMFNGGFLTSTFGLNEQRKYTILDFKETGVNWAYFNHWQQYYKKKIFLEKFWEVIVKVGSISAILLSIDKLLEALKII